MTEKEFAVLYPLFRDVITAIARKLVGSDDALVEDLEQEGAIAMWRLDLRRAKTNPDSYIRQAVKFKMIDSLRSYAPDRYVSLHSLRQKGWVVDDDGELYLTASGGHRVPLFARDTDYDDGIEVDRLLGQVSEQDADMIRWMFGLESPDGWTIPRKMPFRLLAVRLAQKHGERVLCEATLRYRRESILSYWRMGIRPRRRRSPRAQAA